jgi:steroid 5-alpha reductase family enzyme
MAALLGLGIILTALTLVWMISVRRRDASVADICWVRATPSATLSAVDGLGIALFAVGFGFEVVGDYQLERFRAETSDRGAVLDRELWRYTRHPNYFGDARCGGACMLWRHQRQADGSPC